MEQEFEYQFLQLVKVAEAMQQRIEKLEQTNQLLIRSNKQTIDYLNDTIKELEDFKGNIRYELSDPRLQAERTVYPDIRPGEEAIDLIVKEKKSMARFGDGEFAAIAGRVRHKFQTEADAGLAKRLQEVLSEKLDNLLVCIADNYGSLEKYNEQGKREIRRYMKPEVRKEHMQLLDLNRRYYDTYVTRPYVMYADNHTDAPKWRFENLKRIWQDRECIFVEGEYTVLGVGNDLFGNAARIQRIIAPAENAFRQYDRILSACLDQPREKLFLIALGPTAGVLAYDLCRQGYQAVDIGHVDMEYEWYLRNEGRRTEVKGKYNNEVPGGDHPKRLQDPAYMDQILKEIL